MRAQLELVSKNNNNHSFLCYEVCLPSFEFFWHYHPEYELTCIVKGRGKRIVGDSYEPFSEGDLVLLGPHLSHSWVSEKIYKQKKVAIVLQFSLSYIEPLLQYDEMNAIKNLLKKATKGLQFPVSKTKEIKEMMQLLLHTTGANALALFIQILQKLTGIKSNQLASENLKPLKGNENQQRINKVFSYVQKNLSQFISLKTASQLVHLSESAFCKFFKRASGKTFSDYVNEIRIAHACEMLIETDKPINQIAGECGFESLTYFNRIFLKKKKITPKLLRTQF